MIASATNAGGLAIQADPVVSPLESRNQADSRGAVSKESLVRQVVEGHVAGLEARRERDLNCEKLLLHIDGTGDFQWADILHGTKVEIPRYVSEYRKTENLLRLIVDNAVAHHTTMDLRYHAESRADRKSKQQAIVDSLWINDLSYRQDFNGLFAEALYMAMPAGFCPVHAYWREDTPRDWYEPIGHGPASIDPRPGMIDCWVGNPFDTVFDLSAKRSSLLWCSYGRTLPLSLVRRKLGHIPGVLELQGMTRTNSASEIQRIARSWMSPGLGMHGHSILSDRKDEREELVYVICRETAPYPEPGYEEGRLTIVAVPGNADFRRGRFNTSGAILLADQPLPGADFSFTNFYSHHRGNDIHGKPWVEDFDQLQVDLNIAKSRRWEAINRMIDAPIVSPGGAISDDMLDLDGYKLLEIEPSLAGWRPRVMEWPQAVVPALDNEIRELRQAIFTGGGYQAASRGEAPGSRMAYRAILALQQADNTIHGPVNVRFQRSATDFAQRCHSQMRAYGDVPYLVNIIGDEFAHLVSPYISKDDISRDPPQYKLVNAFGSSPELRAQEVLELMQLRGADGEVFLTTEEARRQYPSQMIFNAHSNPSATQIRRAKTVASAIHEMAEAMRAESGFDLRDPGHPWVEQMAVNLFFALEKRYPRKRDDLLDAHLATLSEITQDETADPIARRAAEMRQDLYYQWQAMMAGVGNGAAGGGGSPAGPGQAPSFGDRSNVAAEMASGGGMPGTTLNDVDGKGQTAAASAPAGL